MVGLIACMTGRRSNSGRARQQEEKEAEAQVRRSRRRRLPQAAPLQPRPRPDSLNLRFDILHGNRMLGLLMCTGFFWSLVSQGLWAMLSLPFR